MAEILKDYIEQTVSANEYGKALGIMFNGQNINIKYNATNKTSYWHVVQNLAAYLLKLELLNSTNQASTNSSINHEAKRLKKLHSLGINVPEILAQGSNWLALSDIGPCSAEVMEAANQIEQVEIASQCAFELAKLHQQDRWHGHPTLKCLTYDNGKIGYMGFENDLALAMPLRVRQARDVIVFFNDLANYCPIKGQAMRTAIQIYSENAPLFVLNEVANFYGKSGSLRKLCFEVTSYAKKELKQILAMLERLNTLTENHKAH